MEAKTGKPPAHVIENLLARPRSFSFVQAVRLLCNYHADEWKSAEAFLRHGLAISPDLSLAHPGTDIASLRRIEPGERGADADGKEQALPRYAMTVTFLSLYGASSPLPTFYTEELIEEAREDHDESRRFLDIFNQALYVLYYQAFNAYKLGQRTLEDGDERLALLQRALLGLGLAGLEKRAGLPLADLACIPLFLRHTRTAKGLAVTLRMLLGCGRFDIEQCLPRTVPIGAMGRPGLGAMRLGEDVLGESVVDLEGAFRVHVRGLGREEVADFLPGGKRLARMGAIIRAYLYTPLMWDVLLHLEADTYQAGSLGCCRLGVTAFLCEREGAQKRSYRVSPVQCATHGQNLIF